MKIPCHVVIDLLPNYIDECTSEKTNHDIEEHLSKCSSCKQIYEEMKRPIPMEESHDIDYLKRIKRKQYFMIFSVIMIFILFIILKSFVLGYQTTAVDIQQLDVKNDYVYATVSSYNDDEAIIGYDYDTKDDNQKNIIQFQSVTKSLLHSQDTLELCIPLEYFENYLIMNQKAISRDGQIIDYHILSMVHQRVPYVGDASSVYNLLNLVNMQEEGQFTISLQTSKEPYEITIHFDQPLKPEQKQRVIKKCQLVLSCIDNCDIIHFEDQTIKFSQKVKDEKALQQLYDL